MRGDLCASHERQQIRNRYQHTIIREVCFEYSVDKDHDQNCQTKMLAKRNPGDYNRNLDPKLISLEILLVLLLSHKVDLGGSRDVIFFE